MEIFVTLYAIGSLLALGMNIGIRKDYKNKLLVGMLMFIFSWFAVGLIIGFYLSKDD